MGAFSYVALDGAGFLTDSAPVNVQTPGASKRDPA